MKILFLEGDMSRRGGTERMTSVLANTLCCENDIHVISLKMNNNKAFFQLDERVCHIVLKEHQGKLGILKHIKEIHEYIKKENINWVINVDIGMGFYGILAAKATSAKVITWEHGNYYNNWGSRIFPYLRKFAAKYSDAMVVLTEKDQDNYRANINTKKPICVIPNPVERHDFVYDIESKTILSAGLLLPIKGYDKAIAVAAKVLPKYPEWKWVICGDGPERSYLEELILNAGLQNQVVLPGTITNMEEQYKNASIYVMTSQMEGLPMVLLEAKSWGLPIVSFDIMTGPSDIICDALNGYLIKSYDINEMAEKIASLMDNSDLRASFSEKSQMDMEKFEFSYILNQWKDLLGRSFCETIN